MYSKLASKLLSSVGAENGDKIRIISKEKNYEGLLMPRIEVGDTNCLTLKLSNGYNIGIDSTEISKIELVEKASKVKHVTNENTTESSKNDIVILGCGGTIASKIEYKTGGTQPSITPEELTASFPALEKRNLRSRILFNLWSEDFNPAIWQEIAKETAEEIKRGCKGVVLMHGTDTMHYTSAALSFMLKTPVPIILTGAQRSSDRGSSDNLMNIMSAVALAESDIAEIGVCMHGSINDDFCYLHNGVNCRKMHTSRRDAFRSINKKPIAKVWWQENKIETLVKYNKRRERKLEVDTKINPNVALIYTYPGIKPEFVEKLSNMFDGVVIAGTGLGQVPSNPSNDSRTKSIIPAVKGLIDNNIPVVIAPQTIYGRINLNVYSAGRILNETGAIGHLCDWTPETALVKLMFVLGHTKKMGQIKEMMLTNYTGEISERSELDSFDEV